MTGSAPPPAGGWTLTLPWLDWSEADPARFDLHEMVEFCRDHLSPGWTMAIRNATGRIDGFTAGAPDELPATGHVEFSFASPADLERFRARFGGVP